MKLPPPLKEKISQAFYKSDTGLAFIEELKRGGFHTCIGDSGRVVIIRDTDTKPFALARIIEGAKTEDVRKKLEGLELPALAEIRKAG